MKKVLFISVLCFVTLDSFAQEAISWILPGGQFRDLIYYMVSPKTGEMVYDFVRKVEYRYNIDGGYVVKEINSFQNRPVSTTTRYIQVKKDAVLITKIMGTSIGSDGYTKAFTPSSILFKLPKENQKVDWISKETGDNCTAFYKTIHEDGKDREYLVVLSEHSTEKLKEGRIVISAYYYRYNIGLVKETLISKGKETIMWSLYNPH